MDSKKAKIEIDIMNFEVELQEVGSLLRITRDYVDGYTEERQNIVVDGQIMVDTLTSIIKKVENCKCGIGTIYEEVICNNDK